MTTSIKADRQTCFDLARDIDLHQKTTIGTKEKAIAGVTSGRINMGETVTWEATHLGCKMRLTSKITAFDAPDHFRDMQIKGPFKSLEHDHYFKTRGAFTIMTDVFKFQSPFGLLGRLFNAVILTSYMRRFLSRRNDLLKDIAQSGQGSGSRK